MASKVARNRARMGSVKEELQPSIPLDGEDSYDGDDSPYALERPLQTINRFSRAFEASFSINLPPPPSLNGHTSSGPPSRAGSRPTSVLGTPTGSSLALSLARPASMYGFANPANGGGSGFFDPLAFADISPYDAALSYSSKEGVQGRRGSMFFGNYAGNGSGSTTPETRSLYETSNHSPLVKPSPPPPMPLSIGLEAGKITAGSANGVSVAGNGGMGTEKRTSIAGAMKRRGTSELGKSPLQDSVLAIDDHEDDSKDSKSKRASRFMSLPSRSRRAQSEFTPSSPPRNETKHTTAHGRSPLALSQIKSNVEPTGAESKKDNKAGIEKTSWAKRTFVVFFRRGSFKAKKQRQEKPPPLPQLQNLTSPPPPKPPKSPLRQSPPSPRPEQAPLPPSPDRDEPIFSSEQPQQAEGKVESAAVVETGNAETSRQNPSPDSPSEGRSSSSDNLRTPDMSDGNGSTAPSSEPTSDGLDERERIGEEDKEKAQEKTLPSTPGEPQTVIGAQV